MKFVALDHGQRPVFAARRTITYRAVIAVEFGLDGRVDGWADGNAFGATLITKTRSLPQSSTTTHYALDLLSLI